MITETRNYIKGQISSVNADLKQLDDPFGTIDLNENELEFGYKIIFLATDLIPTGNHNLEIFPISIELYKKVFRDIVEDYDIVFDNAIAIRDKIANIVSVKANTNFYRALPVSFTPEDLELNQRVVKITITLNFERAISFC